MTRPSYRSLNQPRLLCGIAPLLLCGSFMGAALVFSVTANIFAGALLGGLFYLLSLWATAIDSQIDQVFLKAISVSRYYDPLRLEQRRFSNGKR